MTLQVYAGLTSQTVDVFLGDSSSTTGAGLTGLVYNTSGLKCYYRKGATGTATAITLATQTVGGVWSSGGFVEVDATNMPGVYRLDLPNAAVDTAGFVTLYFSGASNLMATPQRVDCRALVANVKLFGDAAGTFSSGRPEVNTTHWAGTAVASAAVRSDLVSILGTALTEADAGNLAAAFKKLFDVLSPVLTAASVNQTGDSFARIGTNGAGLTALGDTRLANLSNLDVAISVIQSQITALNNLSAKANWFGSALLEIPDSGTRAYVFELVIKDDEDKLVNLDALPTITLTNSAGTDRSALITTGITNAATGRYTLTITVGTSTTNEALLLKATGTVSGETRYAVLATQVVDYDSGSIINTIYTRLGVPTVSIADDIAGVKTVVDAGATASALTSLSSKVGTPTGVSLAADIASVKTDTGTTIPGLFTTLTTKVRKFLQLLVRKDAAIATDNATELTELNANGGSGAGSYSQLTDSLEAIRDRGDAAWTTGAGGGGDVQISSEAVVVARLPIGATAGWPQTLMIGNAYLQDTQTAPKFFVKDIDDNILTALGSKNFDDADFVATLRLSPLTTGENGTVDDNQPATTIEITSDDAVGIVYDDSTADSEFFWLQIPRAKTLLGEINTRYSAQFIMNWGEDETYEWGINLGEIKFHRKNAAAV